MRRKKEGLEYVPATGVRADLKRFMSKFLECNTVRFEQFVNVWRDNNMVYLCAGRATDREAREFLELVLQIAQEYLLPPYLFQVRVGGLYILYAIYEIQPVSPKVKIRMTPSHWQETVFFQQQAAQQNHLDVVYVFQRLVQEQAFLFCFTPSEMSLYSAMKDTDEIVDDLDDTMKEEKTVVTSLFTYESLENLSYLQDQYQQMKIGLAGPEATEPDKSLAVVQTELVDDVVVLLQSFREKVSSLSRQGQKFEAANRDNVSVQTIGSKRQKLKSQAYNQLRAQTSKRQTLVVVNAASTSPKTTALPGSGEAARVANKNALLPVRKNTKKSLRRTRAIDSVDATNSDGDSDKDYVPVQNNRAAKNKMRGGKMRLGDQRQVAADSSTKLNTAKGGTAGLEVSAKSMPLIDTYNEKADDHYSPKRHFVHANSCKREVLAEQNAGIEQPAQNAQAVRKRGRPKKCPELTWAEKVHNAQIHKQPHSGQENCSQGGGPPFARNHNHVVSQCQDDALPKPKRAVKFEKTGKEEEQVRQQSAAETKSTPKRRGRPPKSAKSMPEIVTTNETADDHHSPRRHLVHAKSYRQLVLTEHNVQAVRKRGRPKKCPELTWAEEVHNAQIHKQPDSGQENCSQGPPVARNNNHVVSQCQDALLKPKRAVTFEKTGKEEEQVLQQGAAKSKSTPKRRGRPSKRDLLTKGQEVSMSELIVCSDNEHNTGGKKAKYELVYLPTGMTSARHASSYNTDWETLQATLNYVNVKSGSVKETVKEITSKVTRRKVTPRAKDGQKAKVGRPCQSSPGTVTEILVGIGEPGVVQYQVVHKAVHRDKCSPALQSSHKDTVVASENGSNKAGSAEERNSSQPVKGLHHNADDSFNRQRQQFERRLAEADTEPVAQSVNRSMTVDGEINSSELVSTTPRKQSSVNDSIQRLKERCQKQLEEEDKESMIHSVKRHMNEEREINHLELVFTTQQKTEVKEPSAKTSRHKSALLNEPSGMPQNKVELLNEPSAKSPQQTGVISEPSVKPKQDNEPSEKPEQNTVVLRKLLSTPPVKLHQKAVGLSEPPVKLHQKAVGLSEPPVKLHQKAVGLSEPPVKLHQKAVGLSEPPAKSKQTAAGLSEPPVKSKQTAVGLSEPPVKLQQKAVGLSEPPVKSKQTAVGLSEPPVKSKQTTVGLSEPPVKHQQTAVKLQQKVVGLSEPPVKHQQTAVKLQQKAVGLSEPPVKSQQTTVGLSEPPAKSQQTNIGLSEPPVKSQQTNIGLSEPPVKSKQTTVGLSEPPVKHQQTAVKLQQKAVGLSEPPVKSQQTTVGLSEPPAKSQQTNIGLSEPPAKSQQTNIGLSEPPAKSQQTSVGLSEPPVNLQQKAVGLSEPPVKLQQKAVGLSEPSVTLQQKAVGLSEPPVKLQQKAVGLSEPPVKLQHKALGLSEPPVKLQHKAVGLSEPPVKRQQTTVGLSEPPVKRQQTTVGLSEPPVKRQQTTVGLSEQPGIRSQKTLLNEPPKTTHQLSVGASAHSEVVTTDESPHKVSETRNMQTVFKGDLPPWTSKHQKCASAVHK
ncbi:hypothetical protein BsWGS_06455 [Bradybaena similaris]